jgi:hypothetical protein
MVLLNIANKMNLLYLIPIMDWVVFLPDFQNHVSRARIFKWPGSWVYITSLVPEKVSIYF